VSRRNNEFLIAPYQFPVQHAALTATGTIKAFVATERTIVLGVQYINPTGLALDASNGFAIEMRKGSTVVANGISTTVAAVAANTHTAMSVASNGANVLEAGDVLSAVFTETGTATLPAGSFQLKLAPY
jgi:hypothetical protein